MDHTDKKTLGNYRLGSLLGRGGFAEVYLGEHMYLKTPAAIKVLHIAASTEALANFLLEARTIAHLEHTHIVRVLEFSMEDSTPYLVMSYAPNGSLRQKHPRGTMLDLPTITRYIKQLAGALQYAHDQQLVHRDVKPENVLLGSKDELMLSDFGLAIVSQSGHQWQKRREAGTIRYTAPEQLANQPCFASDQYSLAIMAYEWLCGNVPFMGKEIILQHMRVPPPPLYEKVPGLAPEIEHVVMKALAKDPKQRYPRIAQFAEAFEQACANKLIIADSMAHNQHEGQQNTPQSILQASAQQGQVHALHQSREDPHTSGTLRTSDQRDSSSFDGRTRRAPENTPDFDLPPLYSLDIFPTQPRLRARPSRVHVQQRSETPPSAKMEKASDAPVKRGHKGTRWIGLAAIFCIVALGAIVLTHIGIPRGQTLPPHKTASAIAAASTQAPVQTFHAPGTPGAAATSAPASSTGATVTASAGPKATPTVQASPTPASAALSVTITAIPTTAQNKSDIKVQVHTNQPGISVKISMTYSESGNVVESGPQITDSQGNATITLTIHVPGGPHASGMETVVAIATDQSGQQVMSRAKQVQIGSD